MLIPGLMSVTFRKLSPARIIELAAAARLQAICWTGDVHIKPGDLETAGTVANQTREAGLQVADYGSYYCLADENNEHSFNRVLDTASAMGAPSVRVWPGHGGSAKTSVEQRSRIVEDARRIADLAAARSIDVTFEYHDGSLTDTAESARDLIEQIDRPNVSLLWQPPNHLSSAQRLENLERVVDLVMHLHVFHWTLEPTDRIVRHPLATGANDWQQYLHTAEDTNQERFVLLEFVLNDNPEQMRSDAATLLAICEQARD